MSRRLCAVTALALFMASPGFAQRSNIRAVRDRLANASPLDRSDVAEVLQAAREALGYASFRFSLTPNDSGPEVLMAPDGRPLFLRATSMSVSMWWSLQPSQPAPQRDVQVEGVKLTHYTRHAVEYCDGSLGPSELVVEYEKRSRDAWTVSARQWSAASEPFAQIFAMLSGELPLEDVGRTTIDGRQVRGLRAAWIAAPPFESNAPQRGRGAEPRSAQPAGAVQTLWIDERTFVPLKWTVSATGAGAPSSAGSPSIDTGLFFSYDNTIELRPPAGVEPPACLDPR